MRKSISLILVLVLAMLVFSGCSQSKKEESIETNSNSIKHNSNDFGSDGWHKYRIRNKK